jgi:hypothetical protein
MDNGSLINRVHFLANQLHDLYIKEKIDISKHTSFMENGINYLYLFQHKKYNVISISERQISSVTYVENQLNSCMGLPSYINLIDNILEVRFHLHGKLHNIDFPSLIRYNVLTKEKKEIYALFGNITKDKTRLQFISNCIAGKYGSFHN